MRYLLLLSILLLATPVFAAVDNNAPGCIENVNGTIEMVACEPDPDPDPTDPPSGTGASPLLNRPDSVEGGYPCPAYPWGNTNWASFPDQANVQSHFGQMSWGVNTNNVSYCVRGQDFGGTGSWHGQNFPTAVIFEGFQHSVANDVDLVFTDSIGTLTVRAYNSRIFFASGETLGNLVCLPGSGIVDVYVDDSVVAVCE